MKLIFFDYDKNIVDAMIKIISMIQFEKSKLKRSNINPIFEYIQCDVRKLNNKVDIFVSPANSHGYMDGGIDEIYSKMFKGIGEAVRIKNKQMNIKNARGQYILPIGSTTVVNIPNPDEHVRPKLIICAPTMELPCNITGTRNVYYAMLAILRLAHGFSYETVVGIPGLGTGVGELSGEECSTQIHDAIRDFINDICDVLDGNVSINRYPMQTRYNECDYFVTDKHC